MKKVLSTILAVTLALSLSFFVFAAVAPDSIDLPASMGKVAFPHKKHQEMLQGCTSVIPTSLVR
jgi:Spy/CpxP family protein refolding chaperone